MPRPMGFVPFDPAVPRKSKESFQALGCHVRRWVTRRASEEMAVRYLFCCLMDQTDRPVFQIRPSVADRRVRIVIRQNARRRQKGQGGLRTGSAASVRNFGGKASLRRNCSRSGINKNARCSSLQGDSRLFQKREIGRETIPSKASSSINRGSRVYTRTKLGSLSLLHLSSPRRRPSHIHSLFFSSSLASPSIDHRHRSSGVTGLLLLVRRHQQLISTQTTLIVRIPSIIKSLGCANQQKKDLSHQVTH